MVKTYSLQSFSGGGRNLTNMRTDLLLTSASINYSTATVVITSINGIFVNGRKSIEYYSVMRRNEVWMRGTQR